jgi:SAM-dependent methyltransferase
MQSFNAAIKYVHEEDVHNLQSPAVIVPYLVEKFKPASVVDIGCGIGTFLSVFKENGVKDVLGVDGKWVNKSQLYINESEFLEADLEKPISLDRQYDLVICLEVAEHLAPTAAETLVNSLTSLGKTIVFSAATDKQGGQNHLNEQPFYYWKEKFEKKGYRIIDLFRPVFWNDTRIQWWYKQNMFLILHPSIDTKALEDQIKYFTYNDLLIHPELYYERIREYEKKSLALDKLGAGEGGNFNLYLMLLFRSFKKSLKF